MVKRNVELERATVLDADLPTLVRMARMHDPNYRKDRLGSLIFSVFSVPMTVLGLFGPINPPELRAMIIGVGILLLGLAVLLFRSNRFETRWPTRKADKHLVRDYLVDLFLNQEQIAIVKEGPQRAGELRSAADNLDERAHQLDATEAQDGRIRTERLANRCSREAARMRREADAIEAARAAFFQTRLGHFIVSAEMAVQAELTRRTLDVIISTEDAASRIVTAAECAESIDVAFAGVRLDAATMAPEFDAADPALDEAVGELTDEACATQPRSRIAPADITDVEFEGEPGAATAASPARA
jgi:hypothetical protein